jgi:hypothetical protein
VSIEIISIENSESYATDLLSTYTPLSTIDYKLKVFLKDQPLNIQWSVAPRLVAVHLPFERVPDRRGWLTMLKGEVLLVRVVFPG